MKSLKSLLVVLAGIFIFTACQKEFSFESGFSGGRGKGSLHSAGGNCQPIIIGGYYLQDSTLNDSNYVIVTLNVTNPGTYNIFTETKNGFSFSDSGFFIRTGPQELRLQGTGKPLAIQQTLFTVTFDTSVCVFAIDVTDTIILPAVYNFSQDTASGTCVGDSVMGIYKVGVPLNSSNRVDASITVASPGKYTIITDTIHGIWFKASGIVYGTGVKTITFNGFGIPDSSGAGTHTFTTTNSNGTSSCGFKVKIDTGAVATVAGWSFSQGASAFSGLIDSASHQASPFGGSILAISGSTSTTNPGDSIFSVVIELPGTTIQTGTYSTNTGLLNAFGYTDTAGNVIYGAASPTPTVNVDIIITSFNTTTRVVKGTFSGTAQDAASNPVPITNGKFEATIP